MKKKNGRWGIKGYANQDYSSLLEQGGFGDEDQNNLLKAVVGRVKAAVKHKQFHFDEMELGHRQILAAVIAVILYHRSNELFM